MEIAPGVHSVQLLGATGHLLLGDEITLIDTGLPGSGALLKRQMRRLGLDLADLARVVCTHGHPDHAGGVRGLARVRAGHLARKRPPDGDTTSAVAPLEVRMHPADADGLRVGIGRLLRQPTRGRLFAWVTPTPADLRPLADGEILPIGGLLGGLRVVHAPGHTPGSVCLYLEAQRLLFVGDALEVRHGRVEFASRWYSDDRPLAEHSVKRMAELDVDVIVFSHYRPWRADASGVLRALAARATEATRATTSAP